MIIYIKCNIDQVEDEKQKLESSFCKWTDWIGLVCLNWKPLAKRKATHLVWNYN